MGIVNVNNLSFSFGTRQILDNASFSVGENDKCGLIGVNGSGKSTLFKLLCGELVPDGGSVHINRNYSLGYFRQSSEYNSDGSGETIGTAVRNIFKPLIDAEERIRLLEDEISRTENSVRQSELIRKCDALRTSYEMGGGYEYQSRIRGIMKGLDIGQGIHDKTLISTLSGGQKTRLSLALILARPPDVLLLDEPTNHLDIRSLEWLEEFLVSYKKSFVVISHDRYFLDKVTAKVIELENHALTTYYGNYSYFLKKKSEDREIQQRHFINQQKEIARQEAYIEQQRRWNRERNIVAAESRQKALDRMERIEKPKNLPEKINVRFRKTTSSGNDALYIEGISKSYGSRLIFGEFSSVVKKNERIFVIGPNGCGKSTFMRILAGELAQNEGMVGLGRNTKIGYYDQGLAGLNSNNTVLDETLDVNSGATFTEVRNLLGAFLFSGDDVQKKVKALSGGEKSRVALAKLILSDANMLLLDEPTNHLDINSREAFEASLRDFDGTVIAISHDRYFIKGFATRILYFQGTEIKSYQGGYESYLLWWERNGGGVVEGAAPRTIDSRAIDSRAIDSRAIGSGEIDSRAIDSGAIDNRAIDSGAIDFRAIGSGSIGSRAIDSGSIGSGEIDSGPIDARAINSKAIDSEPIDSRPIDFKDIDFGAIDSGAVDSRAIGSGEINSVPIDAGTFDPVPKDSGGHFSAKLEYYRVKEARSTHKKLLSKLRTVEDKIEKIETRLSEIETEMILDDVICDHVRLSSLSLEQAKLNEELDECLELWESVSNSIEGFKLPPGVK